MQLKTTYLTIIILINNAYYSSVNSLIIVQNAASIHCTDLLINCSIEVKYPNTAMSLISGQGTALKPFPPEMRVRVVLQRQIKNKNITFGNPIEHNACDYIKNDKLLYPGFLKYGNFPRSCPLPVQTYIVKDYQVPIKHLPPIIPKGTFIATLHLMLKNITFAYLTWVGETVDN